MLPSVRKFNSYFKFYKRKYNKSKNITFELHK